MRTTVPIGLSQVVVPVNVNCGSDGAASDMTDTEPQSYRIRDSTPLDTTTTAPVVRVVIVIEVAGDPDGANSLE